MGTSNEWMHVLEFGGIFGLVMLFLDAIFDSTRVATWPNLIGTALASLLFGMVDVFGWRALHGGLAAILAMSLLAVLGSELARYRVRRRQQVPSKTS